MEIELTNLYITSIFFGLNDSHKIVIADNLKEAIETIHDYFEKPEINYIFNMEELKDLSEKLTLNEKLTIVLELSINGNGLTRLVHEEWNLSSLDKKYKDKEAIIITKQMVDYAIQDALLFISNPNNTALISKSFTL